MKVKPGLIFGISVAAGLTAGLSAAFFITTAGSFQADAALTSQHQNISENFSMAAIPSSDLVTETDISSSNMEEPVFQEALVSQASTVPQEEVQTVFYCDIDGCPRTEYHEHGVCPFDDCTETCPHAHDGVYCYPHHVNDGHSYHHSGYRSGHHGGHHQ